LKIEDFFGLIHRYPGGVVWGMPCGRPSHKKQTATIEMVGFGSGRSTSGNVCERLESGHTPHRAARLIKHERRSKQNIEKKSQTPGAPKTRKTAIFKTKRADAAVNRT
jgi:hypothetical protein